MRGKDMSETIFRIQKNADNPFVMIDKNVFEDTSLSFKAKGILGYLLSRPNDWTLIIADIQKRSTNGKDSVKNGIDELIERGYIVKTEQPRQAGKFATCDYVVYEKPMNTSVNRCGKTVAAKPSRLNRHGKSATTNNDELSNELTNKNIYSEKQKKQKSDVVEKINPLVHQEKKPSKHDLEIKEIFETWLSLTGQKIKLDAKRKSNINARLENGYSLEQIKQAMSYVANSQWHKENGQVRLELVVRSNEQLDQQLIKATKAQPNNALAVNQNWQNANRKPLVANATSLEDFFA